MASQIVSLVTTKAKAIYETLAFFSLDKKDQPWQLQIWLSKHSHSGPCVRFLPDGWTSPRHWKTVGSGPRPHLRTAVFLLFIHGKRTIKEWHVPLNICTLKTHNIYMTLLGKYWKSNFFLCALKSACNPFWEMYALRGLEIEVRGVFWCLFSVAHQLQTVSDET